MGTLCPEAKLAADFAVLCWGDGRPSVLPKGISSDGFPFVPGVEKKADPDTSVPPSKLESGPLGSSGIKLRMKASDLDVIRESVQSLVRQGKSRATSEEILETMPEGEQGRFTSAKTGKLTTKLGILLSHLNVPSEKMWTKERNNSVRVYRLDEMQPDGREPVLNDPADSTGSTEA